MGEGIFEVRSRFIRRLLEQNFVAVRGPRVVEEEKRVYFDVWKSSRSERCVHIAFDFDFLSEAGNDFARTTLEALKDAKGMLKARAWGKAMSVVEGVDPQSISGSVTP